MARSNKYHVIAAFTAGSAGKRDHDWVEFLSAADVVKDDASEPDASESKLVRLREISRELAALGLSLDAVKQCFDMGGRLQIQQQLKISIVVKKPIEGAQPPFFVSTHPISRTPLQLILYQEEFETTSKALEWLDTLSGEAFSLHADYATVLFTGT